MLEISEFKYAAEERDGHSVEGRPCFAEYDLRMYDDVARMFHADGNRSG